LDSSEWLRRKSLLQLLQRLEFLIRSIHPTGFHALSLRSLADLLSGLDLLIVVNGLVV
jgi:hypothetical protein